VRAASNRYVRGPLVEYRWPIIGALAVLALALGYQGFDQLAATHAESFFDKLYRSLQLFTLQITVDPPLNVKIEVARWMAWMVAIAATVGALLGIFRDHVGRLRARLARDPVVICGLGRGGGRLAAGFRDRGCTVVVIENNRAAPGLETSRREGIIVLHGDATEPTMLRRAGIRRARYIIAACGDDGLNVDVAMNAHDLVDPDRDRPLNCFTHVVDPDVRQFLKEFAIRTPKAQAFRLEPFDVSELGAPGILVRYPPFDDAGQTEIGSSHVVIIGLGETGRRLVLGAAQLRATTRPKTAQRLRLTVIDKAAAVLTEGMATRYPMLEDLVDLTPMSVDVDSPLFPGIAALETPAGVRDGTIVYVCLDEELRGLRTALILRRTLKDLHALIVVRTTERSTLTTFPVGLDSPSVNVQIHNMLEHTCTPEIVLLSTNEVLAQAIHAEYVRTETARGESPQTNPSMVEWQFLPSILKDSNRDQASNIGSKLRKVGCDIKSVTDLEPAPPAEFSPSEIERLAKFEHERWLNERTSAGWTRAPQKNIDTKKSPYLVPWQELSEETREHDRNTVRGMPAFLAKAGLAICRVDGTADPIDGVTTAAPPA
jgi:voltage-gated potassium channel Kch